MSASQRVSRGFHRLGLVLDAIPLVWSGATAIVAARDVADRKHETVLCGHAAIKEANARVAAPAPKSSTPHLDELLQDAELLKQCATGTDNPVTVDEARNPPDFYWSRAFVAHLSFGLGIALLIAGSIYAAIRAIAWVISGFVAS